MRKTLIKFCGFTRPQDAALAEELGADFLGLNFFAGPRQISRDTARQILATSSSKITPVALTACHDVRFPDSPDIDEIIGENPLLPITTFQIYGYGISFKNDCPYTIWRVHSVSNAYSNLPIPSELPYPTDRLPVQFLVVDAAVQGKLGGTGVTLDWKRLAGALKQEEESFPKIILAGGLNPDNVGEAIRIVRPYAVDVSSGIESGTPGIKDPGKMKAFVEAVCAADRL